MRWKHAAYALLLVVLTPLAALHVLLRGSLAQLDGTVHSSAVSRPVTIERDDLGVPTITASNRIDLAYATGFVHGQDRFFEMDLSRRLAAGELSELLGQATLGQDEAARIFRFRSVAHEVLQRATAGQRAIIEAYSRGVNDGLGSLRVRPWEYLVLGSAPAPWRPEDSVLVLHAMWWQLQYLGFHREILRQEVNARLGGRLCERGWKCALAFFYPARTAWDAPVVAPPPAAEGADGGSDRATARGSDTGTGGPESIHGDGHGLEPGGHRGVQPEASGAPDFTRIPEIPSAAVLDLRKERAPNVAHVAAPAIAVGSNNWAVAGRLTSTGSALVANDMHLGQRVPVIWYRMRLRTASSPAHAGIDLTGVTLPGAPVMVAGSNGHIAWGFTNSYGKWLDVTLVPCTAVTGDGLVTSAGTVPLHTQWEAIRVHGEATIRFPVRTGKAGVLLEAHPRQGQCWLGSWLAQDPDASNFNLMSLESVDSVRQAVALAPTIGIPHQNFVAGDRDGHIGWAIYGRIPAGTGAERNSGRIQWLGTRAQPSAIDPPSGRIWTANARVTSDPQQERAIAADTAGLGSQYDLGARAHQIRDDLRAIVQPAVPADMLRIQLDDRAQFLARWRELLLQVLDENSLRDHPVRAEFRRQVLDWDPAADTASVGYRLLRAWHDRIETAVWDMILDGLHIGADESFATPAQFEAPLWRLLQARPLNFLPARYPAWHDFLLEQTDATIAGLREDCGVLSRCTWGRENTTRIRHPLSAGLSRVLPFVSRLLDMPVLQMPGDRDMPRVQGETFGASERFGVSPGHERQGYFHMPGGQSGHPLSPYYRAGFMEWARGEPLPFLPGPARHTMKLLPR